ncbi:MAG: Hsp20/alpha crystallin family protein, partial [Deltaproteobacteria bacterium]|nr:Hsp20/alpha crystallin family protein [Deltaproteobacteria bacterium]
ADVPGVGPEDLLVTLEGRAFTLSTRPGAARRFQKELSLPCEVDPRTLVTTCRNGVLEARVDKK